MNDIQEQMVQAIEQMKENSFSNQKQNADMGIIRLMWKYSDMWEKIKSWGSGFPIGYDFTIGYCGDIREYLMENYCNFLDILDQKEILCKEEAFGVKPGMQAEDIIEKWNNCYNQRRWTIPENAFLKAITGLSKEAMKILRTFYPEELTCSHAIAWDCISYSHVQYFQNYLKLFREELFEALKSEKLLYFIFWESFY